MIELILYGGNTPNVGHWFEWLYNRPSGKPYTESGYGWYYILDKDVHKWFKDNDIKYELFTKITTLASEYNQYGIRFLNKEDAILFKLTWF